MYNWFETVIIYETDGVMEEEDEEKREKNMAHNITYKILKMVDLVKVLEY